MSDAESPSTKLLQASVSALFSIRTFLRHSRSRSPETGTAAAVIDGETLKLADSRIVRLMGAKAPIPPLGPRGDDL
jgi:hypothetical protein